jgi:hypothetical protein
VIRETGNLDFDVKKLMGVEGAALQVKVCEKCNGDQKVDFKKELLSRAKISIEKHLQTKVQSHLEAQKMG